MVAFIGVTLVSIVDDLAKCFFGGMTHKNCGLAYTSSWRYALWIVASMYFCERVVHYGECMYP
mgnify:CR=1 FL=1